MKASFRVLIFLLIAIPVQAQVQLSATVGISGSANMGDIGPSPVLKSTLTAGGRLQFENNLEFNPMDKYTKAGWSVSDGVGILVFPSDSGLFFIGGADYRHRNGGSWAKDGVRIGGGVGYEKDNSQLRFSVKDKVISLNDNVKYYPYFEFLARGDYPLQNSNWSLRTEAEIGLFKYVQNNIKRTAFYSNAILGLVYKWP